MSSVGARRRTVGWIVAAVTVMLAVPVLAASYRSSDVEGLGVSAWALVLALVWTAGGLTIIRVVGAVADTRPRASRTARSTLMIVVGGVLAIGSLCGGLILASWPLTASLVAGPLEAAVSQPVLVLFSVALVAGAAEEVFFRLALPRLMGGVWRWIVPTALYAAVTLVSGTIALAAMAVILGVVAMWVLERTGWWFAPIVVHALWTVAMILVFPQLAVGGGLA